uniref:Uncharacterized protein n=1 Tax=Candidatus Methanophagaceae archaeon ANME-1 ERB6 TaxID=2759912 RepID=A0A7G9YX00_9EURY|nr:hypothetical protein BJKGENCM_00024 [Methanosarcinales archaeon ANME-1 ERB6]
MLEQISNQTMYNVRIKKRERGVMKRNENKKAGKTRNGLEAGAGFKHKRFD